MHLIIYFQIALKIKMQIEDKNMLKQKKKLPMKVFPFI